MDNKAVDIASLREALGWTQLQFAEFFGVDRSTVSKWETDPPTKGPAVVLLRQLIDRLSSSSDAAPAGAEAGPDPNAFQAGAGHPLSGEAA